MRSSAEWFETLIRGRSGGPLAALARAALRAASWPYGIGVHRRNRLYDRGRKEIRQPGLPVVSIGNLTLGGTGKTPCVEYVARFYQSLGARVAILSRGYGARRQGKNDESLVLEENLPGVPHLQGTDRAALAERVKRDRMAEVIVLDDGFQHRRLHRDLDIVLIDATRPPQEDDLFPRGTLREPAASLKRAGAIVLTRCDQVPADKLEALRKWVERTSPGVLMATTSHRPDEEAARLKGKPVAGFCGIGNPDAFRKTLEALGARVIAFRKYPDHHGYTKADVSELAAWARGLPAEVEIVTTQKDRVKLKAKELGGRTLQTVRVALSFLQGEPEFQEKLKEAIAQKGCTNHGKQPSR